MPQTAWVAGPLDTARHEQAPFGRDGLGLEHLSIPLNGAILDVGCGGGRTIAKLAAASGLGMVYGIDHSAESVRVASKVNAKLIKADRVEIRESSVSQLPYANDTFDLVAAVETHFFWPDLAGDVREVLRVVKPGGMFVVIAEVHKGANAAMSRIVEKYARKTGMTLLTPNEHHGLLVGAGFADVQVFTDVSKGGVCAVGRRL
jgi:ubiquinone/menaquinone biosynthesis C-methylase UbiE